MTFTEIEVKAVLQSVEETLTALIQEGKLTNINEVAAHMTDVGKTYPLTALWLAMNIQQAPATAAVFGLMVYAMTRQRQTFKASEVQ